MGALLTAKARAHPSLSRCRAGSMAPMERPYRIFDDTVQSPARSLRQIGRAGQAQVQKLSAEPTLSEPSHASAYGCRASSGVVATLHRPKPLFPTAAGGQFKLSRAEYPHLIPMAPRAYRRAQCSCSLAESRDQACVSDPPGTVELV